ncbi:MAG: MFS transporter [Deltaproteobacteria bacterium]|nr:MFS transporter [Deltaproteobacteria bacterium]
MPRNILFTLLASIFIALLGIGIIAPLMPIYATRLGASGVGLGLMVAGFSVSRGVLQPFVGGLSDRYGRKRFLVAGLIVYALAGITYTVAASVEHLVLIRVFHGVGSAMVIPIAMAYIGDLAPVGEEGRYMGMLNIALFSGVGGGPVIGGLFLDTLGMNSAFYAMAGFSGLSVLLVGVFLPPRSAGSEQPESPRILSALGQMARDARIVGVLVSRMATMLILVPTMAFLPILMTRFMAATGIEVGMVVASRTLVNAAFQYPFGKVVDRYNRVALLLTGSLVVSGAVFATPFAGRLATLIALFALMGMGEALVWPTLGALAVEGGRRYGQGAVMGVFNMAMSAGVLLGSIGCGAAMDFFGLQYAFYLTAVFLVLATAVAAFLIGNAPSSGSEEASWEKVTREAGA